jgi:hypothetical protein
MTAGLQAMVTHNTEPSLVQRGEKSKSRYIKRLVGASQVAPLHATT